VGIRRLDKGGGREKRFAHKVLQLAQRNEWFLDPRQRNAALS